MNQMRDDWGKWQEMTGIACEDNVYWASSGAWEQDLDNTDEQDLPERTEMRMWRKVEKQ